MLRKLAAYCSQNQLDLALQELGRLERTLFICSTGSKARNCADAASAS
jgi:TnpA family transposase